jgi:hypothetical protein
VVDAIGDCPADSSVLTITTVQAADAGLGNAVAVCANGEPLLMVDSLLGTPMLNGMWTGPDGNVHGATFDPAVDPSGNFCYTVTGSSPCPDALACLSITVLEPNDPACLSNAVQPIAQDELRSFPNPNNGAFTLTHATDLQRLEVVDMQGRVVLLVPTVPNTRSTAIDLPLDLPTSGYTLRIITRDRVSVLPFSLRIPSGHRDPPNLLVLFPHDFSEEIIP